MKSMAEKLLFIVIACGFIGLCKAADDYTISGSRITILHVTDELNTALDAVEDKESKVVIVDKACDQKDFVDICQIGWIRKLEIRSRNESIHDLGPLVHLKGLQKLKITSAKMSNEKPFDVGPLAQLTNLVNINFYGTKITNTQAMSSLKNLRNISLYMSAVDSIDFLRGTPEVRVLDLYGAKHSFENYEPLLGLKKLRKLTIYMNPQATDELLAPLKALTSLRYVLMSNCNQVTTLNFLKNCKGLEDINAQWCKGLTDISALSNMDMLKSVYISNCDVSNISELAGKKHLAQLDISKTSVSDISALNGCVSLESLDISETSVSDISALTGCTSLQTLKMKKTQIKDISSLSTCYRLQQLETADTLIEDISPLIQCDNMVTLEASTTIPQQQIDNLKRAFPELKIR